MINSFTAILFFVCMFLLWVIYIIAKDRETTKKENAEIKKTKERLNAAYTRLDEEKAKNENEKNRIKTGSGSDRFNASMDLMHKQSKKSK